MLSDPSKFALATPASAGKAVISLRDVGKCYQTYAKPGDRLKRFLVRGFGSLGVPQKDYAQNFWALRHISLEVQRGEAVGIIGKNGSGKSTLLQIITGVLTPTEGSVHMSGRVAALLELGAGFNPEFSGRENVYINGALLGFSRHEIEKRFDDIAGFADIGQFLDMPVKTYSSGMFVRLAFAVQVQLEPEILIVDEALAVGDTLFQKRCYQRIERFLASGGTLLFVTHDQEIVRTLTTRTLLLDRGECKAVGASSEVVLEYRRLLHDEDSSRESVLAATRAATVDEVPAVKPDGAIITDRFSFGDFDAQIEAVVLFINGVESSGAPTSINPGDQVRVRMQCRMNKTLSHLSFGIRVRNREGVKVYSGGSFAADLNAAYVTPDHKGIWHREFAAGEVFAIDMSFECNLGEGFYEIQAYICEEQMFAPGFQRMLHWKDEAAFFTVVMDRFKRWYGGICDINIQYDVVR